MSFTTERYHVLQHLDELRAEEEKKKALSEEVDEFRSIDRAYWDNEAKGAKAIDYCVKLAKAVLVESTARIYMSALENLIDNPSQYENLMPMARKQIVEAISYITDKESLNEAMHKMSPYLRDMKPLFEDIAKTKDVPEFSDKVLLTNDDVKLIKKWEEDKGKDSYGGVIADRIIDVCKAEQEANQEHQERMQAVADELTQIEQRRADEQIQNDENEMDIDQEVPMDQNAETPVPGTDANMNGEMEQPSEALPVNTAIAESINIFDNNPRSIFNSIYLNRSRKIINENGVGADIKAYANDIFCETICTYALLETINSLGLRSYTDYEKERLKYEFAVS